MQLLVLLKKHSMIMIMHWLITVQMVVRLICSPVIKLVMLLLMMPYTLHLVRRLLLSLQILLVLVVRFLALISALPTLRAM